MKRRQFLNTAGVGASLLGLGALSGCAGVGGQAQGGPHVVVVGGGFGGATCAKYIRMWSEGRVRVTLIERQSQFISCPISNLVISGLKQMSDISRDYSALKKNWGVNVIQGEVSAVDGDKRLVRLADGQTINYDRLVLSPGIDFIDGRIPALSNEAAFKEIPHAWRAGEQTLILRQQLAAMKDGGVYAIAIPKAPYRCPPGPYERACMVADYFKREKPKSKVLILDANDKIQSKEPLFKKAFADLYKDMVEYRPNAECKDVDINNKTAILEFDNVRADVLNIVPPQRAGKIVFSAGLKTINNLWAEVDWLSMESTNVKGVHILGDAVFPAPIMPKSGHMANQHGKLAAAAIVNLLEGKAPNPDPLVMNTCYSFVDKSNVIHVASVHRYNPEKKTFDPNPNGSGGVSAARNVVESRIAMSWAQNIWADSLG